MGGETRPVGIPLPALRASPVINFSQSFHSRVTLLSHLPTLPKTMPSELVLSTPGGCPSSGSLLSFHKLFSSQRFHRNVTMVQLCCHLSLVTGGSSFIWRKDCESFHSQSFEHERKGEEGMRFFRKALVIAGASLTFASFMAQDVHSQVDPTAPLSSMVAITHKKGTNIASLVKNRVDDYAYGALGSFPLPLAAGAADNIFVLEGLQSNVVVKWLDPLTNDTSANAPRYGANNDYIAYFGDGWDKDWRGDVPGEPPQFNGSSEAGWIWSNHEYVSNSLPSATTAPTGQHLTLAKFLRTMGILSNNVEADDGWTQADIDIYLREYKKQLGGSWFRATKDSSGQWKLDRSATNLRYDSTSNTLTRVTGHAQYALDQDDQGTPLPEGIVAGIAGDCSGGQTPWGTVITAEENVQDYYGDSTTKMKGNCPFSAVRHA